MERGDWGSLVGILLLPLLCCGLPLLVGLGAGAVGAAVGHVAGPVAGGVLALALVVFGAIGLGCRGAARRRLRNRTSLRAKGEQAVERIELAIQGMHCLDCARKVERALAGVAQVERAEVQYIRKRAYVIAREGVAVEDLIAAVREAGYDAAPAS
jgi:copper chaperone CopZ